MNSSNRIKNILDVNRDFIIQNLNSEEKKYLKELEIKIGERFPILGKYPSKLGIQVVKNRIITLKIQNIEFDEVPDGIEVLEKLQILIVSNTKLKKLPESIGKLQNLRTLSVDSNLLKKLPESIVYLSKLETLWLDDNPIQFLPQKIGNLKSLKNLGVRYTRIADFPESFHDLINMRHIYVMDYQKHALEDLNRSCSDLVIYPVH